MPKENPRQESPMSSHRQNTDTSASIADALRDTQTITDVVVRTGDEKVVQKLLLVNSSADLYNVESGDDIRTERA